MRHALLIGRLHFIFGLVTWVFPLPQAALEHEADARAATYERLAALRSEHEAAAASAKSDEEKLAVANEVCREAMCKRPTHHPPKKSGVVASKLYGSMALACDVLCHSSPSYNSLLNCNCWYRAWLGG